MNEMKIKKMSEMKMLSCVTLKKGKILRITIGVKRV